MFLNHALLYSLMLEISNFQRDDVADFTSTKNMIKL